MQISGKMMDRLIQVFALIVFIGLVCAFITIVDSGSFLNTTAKDEYALNYAYTDESVE